jgi:superfamily II DNA or RNA helicase
MAGIEELGPGVRITAPWLPGTCIVRVAVQIQNSYLLVVMDDDTNREITREIDGEKLSEVHILGTGDDDENVSGNPDMFRLAIEAMRLGFAHSYDPFFALSVSRVDPLPHQLEAVYSHMLKQPVIRFLLGDDAGAGKTIMAGLLIRELSLRGLAKRILIIPPANLAYQWRREMKDLFGENFHWVKSQDVRDAYAQNPFNQNDRVVVSRDWAKLDHVLNAIVESDRWDLVVIDEAHGMATSNPDKLPSLRYTLAKAISEHTDHLLMMTATPHNGDRDRFRHFLALLDQDAYGDVESLELAIQHKSAPFYLRRLKEAMRTFPDETNPNGKPLFTKRTVTTVEFDISGTELEVYQKLTRYIRLIGEIGRRHPDNKARALGFMMALYQRRFASSPHALLKSLERRKARLEGIIDGTWVPPKKKKKHIDNDMIDELDDETLSTGFEDEEDIAFSEYDIQSAKDELVHINPLLIDVEKLIDTGTSAKWNKLEKMLNSKQAFDTSTDKKLLIFTEHKDTLSWLLEKLTALGYKVVTIHGGMRPGSRDEPNTRLWAEEQFRNEDGAEILLATEAAGEGINLQFCWRMVNWDVPWNPARLEQRIGRIHRYKQKRDIVAFNLIARNTREGQVLHTLQEKIEEIRLALDPDNEGKVFDVIQSVISPSLIEQVMKEVYEENLNPEVACDRVRDEVTAKKFQEIMNDTLENLSSRELNMGLVKDYNAEAKLRRLVPEVLRDFFISATNVVFDNPVKQKKEGWSWNTPNSVYNLRGELKPLGDLGRVYKAFSFHKEDLDERPHLEWVTPGHPLYEGVRRVTKKQGEGDLAKGAKFIDPSAEDPYWLQIFRYRLEDGNGDSIDEQLIVVKVEERTGNISLKPASLFLDIVPSKSRDPVPRLPIDVAMLTTETVGIALEEICEKQSMERSEKAAKVKSHVQTSLNALIRKENIKFEKFERDSDKHKCIERVFDFEQRLDRREKHLDRQGRVVIAQNIPIALAFVEPMEIDTHNLPEGRTMPKQNKEVEEAAVNYVREIELAKPEVHEVKSREADGVGYDLETWDAHGNILRFIEVKGKTTEHDVIITPNEWKVAERLRDDYWLYVVSNPLSEPVLRVVQDPWAKLEVETETKIMRHFLGMEQIKNEAE